MNDGIVKYFFNCVKVWSQNGIVQQIEVDQGYRGLLETRIGIGSTIVEVENSFESEVIEDEEDNLVVKGQRGWSFETEHWVNGQSVDTNRTARISSILVQSP